MAINVDFYIFSKKPDSTKKPKTEPERFLCNLIEPTSATSPNIALIYKGNPTKYNYAFIEDFNRFYFVSDWSYNGGRWIAQLIVDVLASWKTYIGASRQYITRSSAEFDGDIIDTLYPTKTDVVTESVINGNSETSVGDFGNPFFSDYSDGTYIVGIINSDTSAIGSVSYYSFTNSEFRNFCASLMGDPAWFTEGLTEISDEMAKCLFNPFQYIASCMWFPTSFSGTSVTNIHYGWWQMPANAKRIQNPVRAFPTSFKLPKHPQSDRGGYLNKSPFSRYTLCWPVFGQFPLPGEIVGDKSIICECFVDAISGIGTLLCKIADVGTTVFSTQVNIGVNIQISQMMQNIVGVGSSIVSGIGSALTGNIGGLFSSIGDAISSASPQLSTKGSNGSISAYRFPPHIECEFFQVVQEDFEHRGRPLMQKKKISDLSGYTVCADADLEVPCTKWELEKIISYLDGGFYYE